MMKWVKNAIIAIAILVVGIMISGRLKSMATKEEIKVDRRKLEVKVMTANLQSIELPITVYGKLNAAQRTDLLAEVNGTFKGGDHPFLEGRTFKAGEVLIQLDNAEAKANAMSVKGNFINALLGVLPDINQDYSGQYKAFELYYDELSLNTPLSQMPKVEGKLEKFLIARGIQTAYYQAKSSEVRLDKFSIRAPFDGVVAMAGVKLGNLVSPGRALGTFVSTRSYELMTAVTLAYADQLVVGQKVDFTSPDIAGNWEGSIARIAPIVDAATQSINIIVNVDGSTLREGMYLTGTVDGLQVDNALKIPASMVVDNEYIYMVEQDSVLVKNLVTVVEWLDNEIIVKGVEQGALLVNEPTLKAAAGLVVAIPAAVVSNACQIPPANTEAFADP